MAGGWAENVFSTSYVVQLEVFNGPMELLLQLIQRQELDITLVSLAAVTDQYIAHLESLSEPDPDQLADFLVVAAKLLAIKASVLLDRRPTKEEGEEADGQDLVRALEEYGLFRRAAAQLKSWEEQERACFARNVPAALPIRPSGPPEGLILDDLAKALRRLLSEAPPEVARHAPQPRAYTVKDKIAVIEAALDGADIVTFDDLFHPLASRLEIIVTFLAMLELLKSKRVAVTQDAVFSTIAISRPEGAPAFASADAVRSAELVEV